MMEKKWKSNEEERSGRAFVVTITETLKRKVTVYESELKEPNCDEAEQTVRDWWSMGQIILCAEDFTDVEFQAEEGERQNDEEI